MTKAKHKAYFLLVLSYVLGLVVASGVHETGVCSIYGSVGTIYMAVLAMG